VSDVRWLWVALLVVWSVVTGAPTALADATRALDPKEYASETVGPVRWTYPRSATDEVRTLQRYRPHAWAKVVGELGVSVAPELEIRVALNPEKMQQLAPSGVALPGYADGIAFPARGLVLLTLTEPETWLRPDMRSVLTHELSHVALHRAVNGAPIPRWFTEGVAVHQAGEHSLSRIKTLWEGTLQGRLLSLEHMAAGFPPDHRQVNLAYAQSADFVGFMLGGADERVRFRGLLQALSTGAPFLDAVNSAYHVPLGYLERQWRETLSQRFGRWPALLMGLTFLWALGALLLVVAYIRARRRHHRTLRRWEIEEAPLVQARVPVPPPAPAAQVTTLDDFFDKRPAKDEPGIPTVTHEGQNHTLH
jgi:Peptidase MA superfamily